MHQTNNSQPSEAGGSLRSFWQQLRVYVHLSCETGPFRVQVSVPLKHSKPSTPVKKHGHDQRATDIPLSPAAHIPAVQELRKRLQRLGSLLSDWEAAGERVTDELLWRWLKSKGSVEETESCLVLHAEWRLALGRICEADIAGELAAEKVFMQGCDAHGRPVLVVLAARHVIRQRNMDETKRLIAYSLDTAIAAADTARNPLGQILCLFDLTGIGLGNLDTKALRAVFEVLQQHFPESLSELWFLNAPFIFWGLWRVVSPFIQPATRDKIRFLTHNERAAVFEEHIPSTVLPHCYGGQAALIRIEQAAMSLARLSAAQAVSKAESQALGAKKVGRVAALRRTGARVAGSSWRAAKEHNPVWAAKSLGTLAKRGVLAVVQPTWLHGRRPAMSRHARAFSAHMQNAWRNRPPLPRPSYRLQSRTAATRLDGVAYFDVASFYIFLALLLVLSVLLLNQLGMYKGGLPATVQYFL